MMDEPDRLGWSDPWRRWSVVAVCGVAVAALLVGFVWLPSAQSDFGTQGLWASICRAAGVPSAWGDRQTAVVVGLRSTGVVLDAAMARAGADDAVGRGATLAQSCTGCHGARGLGQGSAPNLAGQWPEVIVKQLTDYRRGDRENSVMQAFAASLSDRDTLDLAAYYADLAPWKGAGGSGVVAAPALVTVGAPMRNIAPCASCHGGADRKLGAPWLEGMPKDYLVAQLNAFASGRRRNDSHGQMRNMARQLSAFEVQALSGFYARSPAP